VQMGIRLLIPHGSLMLGVDGIDRHLGEYDPARLTYRWIGTHPEMADLATQLMVIAERGASNGRPVSETFLEQWLTVVDGTDLERPVVAIDQGATVGRPKLTESWFC